jgi:hypothetical protein
MTKDQNQQSHESASELHAELLKHMYFGALIYWGNLWMLGQRNMLMRLGSLEADMNRAEEEPS